MGRPPADEMVASRFQELIEQLGGREGFGYGWQTRVAELLGLHPSDVTKIRKGQRRISWSVANQSARRIGMDPSYFTSPAGTQLDEFVKFDENRNIALPGALERAPTAGARLRDLVLRANAVLEPVLSKERDAGSIGRVDEGLASQLAHEVLEQHLVRAARSYLDARPEDRQLHASLLAWGVLLERDSLLDEVVRRAERAEVAVLDLQEELANLRKWHAGKAGESKS